MVIPLFYCEIRHSALKGTSSESGTDIWLVKADTRGQLLTQNSFHLDQQKCFDFARKHFTRQICTMDAVLSCSRPKTLFVGGVSVEVVSHLKISSTISIWLSLV